MISSCPETWGGSEELWARAAAHLARAGHGVRAFKTHVDPSHPRVRELASLGCPVEDLKAVVPGLRLRIRNRVVSSRNQMTIDHVAGSLLRRRVRDFRPHLVVVSQGENFDGVGFSDLCRREGLPYAVVSQKVADWGFPADGMRDVLRDAFGSARRCFFVSKHNLAATEEQLGTRLHHAAVVRNPFLVPYDAPPPWPEGPLRLACVARMYVPDKGQDILLRVLARPHWRDRDLRVSFFGKGANRLGVEEMAAALGLDNVSFPGHVDDITALWRDHHAVVLPSRAEGLPLALVEAMLCARPGVVTDVGGNAEVVEDGVTGFVAAAATADAVDEALGRAWARRAELRGVGLAAAEHIRRLVPPDPAALFASELAALAAAGAPRAAAAHGAS